MQDKYQDIFIQALEFPPALNRKIQLQVLRLDRVHPVISGNKIFKLHYFLENLRNNTVITFGGAYSNHLVAAAYACKQKNIKCIGIVRGEKPAVLSHTLKHCIEYGMHLHFVSREEYDKKDSAECIDRLINTYGECTIIPEGGFAPIGAKGAAGITDYIDDDATHICCAVGTATTIAGLLMNAKAHQKIIAIPVLKGMSDIQERIMFLTKGNFSKEQLHIEPGYHFGGYAKKNNVLIDFMNDLYNTYQLPTDFVYTAKMLYAVMDMIEHNIFLPNSKVCCIHTGGLQGNASLQKNTLTF